MLMQVRNIVFFYFWHWLWRCWFESLSFEFRELQRRPAFVGCSRNIVRAWVLSYLHFRHASRYAVWSIRAAVACRSDGSVGTTDSAGAALVTACTALATACSPNSILQRLAFTPDDIVLAGSVTFIVIES